MALEERTRVREVLFVQDDATLEWHAHQVSITEIIKDGVIISAQYAAPTALTVAEAGQVLEEAVVEIAAQNSALRKELAALRDEQSNVQTPTRVEPEETAH